MSSDAVWQPKTKPIVRATRSRRQRWALLATLIVSAASCRDTSQDMPTENRNLRPTAPGVFTRTVKAAADKEMQLAVAGRTVGFEYDILRAEAREPSIGGISSIKTQAFSSSTLSTRRAKKRHPMS